MTIVKRDNQVAPERQPELKQRDQTRFVFGEVFGIPEALSTIGGEELIEQVKRTGALVERIGLMKGGQRPTDSPGAESGEQISLIGISAAGEQRGAHRFRRLRAQADNLAAAGDCGQDSGRLRGQQKQQRARCRLLQCFEKRVLRERQSAVKVGENGDTIARLERFQGELADNSANLLNFDPTRSWIVLRPDDVGMIAGDNAPTGRALSARTRIERAAEGVELDIQAVESGGKGGGEGLFADLLDPGEEVSVADAAGLHRLAQMIDCPIMTEQTPCIHIILNVESFTEFRKLAMMMTYQPILLDEKQP